MIRRHPIVATVVGIPLVLTLTLGTLDLALARRRADPGRLGRALVHDHQDRERRLHAEPRQARLHPRHRQRRPDRPDRDPRRRDPPHRREPGAAPGHDARPPARHRRCRSPATASTRSNASHTFGGPRLEADTIGAAFGVQIPYVIDTDFDGFIGMVDDMGGLTVNVPYRMQDSFSGADFQPGVQKLDGHQALSYARNRHQFPNSDLTRTQNQGYLILQALTQFRAANTGPIGTLDLLADLGRHARLDGIGLKDLYGLGRLGLSIDPAQVKNVLVPVVQRLGQQPRARAGRGEPVPGLRRRRRAPVPTDQRSIAPRRPRSVAGHTRARDAAPVTPEPAPDAVATLDAIAAAPELFERVVHRTTLPARAARTAALRTPFHPDVDARLASRGMDALYTHQAEAIDRLAAREHVVVATGTASGKSLCYQLPIVDAAVRGAQDTALLIFPTKALAQDQLRSLRGWLVPGLRAVTYDGDTAARRPRLGPQERHRAAHEPGDGAPGHPPVPPAVVHVPDAAPVRGGRRAARDARDLREPPRQRAAPAPAGVRALRLAIPRSASRAPRSATPPSSRRRCSARRCALVDDDGSPQTERGFALWQRPLLDATTGARASANVETAELLVPVRRRRAPDARVHPEPPRRGARRRPRAGASSPRRAPDGRRPRRRVPRRLPPRGAAGARAAAHERRAARRRGHQRARARHRRRRPRRGRGERVPRHARVAAPAGRAGRSVRPARRGRARGRRRPARPVVRAAPRRAVLPSGRGRGGEPAEPVRARAPRRVRRARAAAHPGRRRVVRSRPRRRRARAGAGRPAQAARREDVLVGPPSARAGHRAAQRHERRVHARSRPTIPSNR